METTQDHETSPTFSATEKKRTHQECEIGPEALQSSNGPHRRQRSKAINKSLRRKRRNSKEKLEMNNDNRNSDSEDEEKVGVEKRIMLLQSIIPGGESLGIDKLFEETALYILALQGQVKAIKILTSLLESLEKDKPKF